MPLGFDLCKAANPGQAGGQTAAHQEERHPSPQVTPHSPACMQHLHRQGAPLPTASCHKTPRCPQNLSIPRQIVAPLNAHSCPQLWEPSSQTGDIFQSTPTTHLVHLIANAESCPHPHESKANGGCTGTRHCEGEREPVPRCRQTQTLGLRDSLGTFINPRLGRAVLPQLCTALCLG